MGCGGGIFGHVMGVNVWDGGDMGKWITAVIWEDIDI